MWQNLVDILHRGVARYLLNSLIVAGGATAIAMLCGIPAAYALARMKFKGKNAFLGFVIVSQMFSPVVLLIGISQLMTTLHLNNSLIGGGVINRRLRNCLRANQGTRANGCTGNSYSPDLRIYKRMERIYDFHGAYI